MSELSEPHDDVKLHYTVDDLGDRVLEALAASGVDLDRVTVDDLAPVDAFHIRGRQSTEELARLAGLRAGDRILDAGCGIGGTSRYLAATHGCRVVGIDLTDDYIDVARMLTGRVGLDDAVEFHVGSVVDLPFDDASFDVAWTEHAQMNIADKQSLYGELFRLLKPGGTLAFHDVFEGPEGDPHFPVPWAPDASISHLVRIEELRALLGGAGFSQLAWEDRTAASTAFFHAALERPPEGPGLHVVMEDPKTKLGNLLRNLEEGRVCVVQAVMRKPA